MSATLERFTRVNYRPIGGGTSLEWTSRPSFCPPLAVRFGRLLWGDLNGLYGGIFRHAIRPADLAVGMPISTQRRPEVHLVVGLRGEPDEEVLYPTIIVAIRTKVPHVRERIRVIRCR
jgi:hypothetical protein